MERKVKYNYEFKLLCVQEVLSGYSSIKSVAVKYGFSDSMLKKWIKFYQKFGPKGLQSRQPQSYDASFKLKVLETINNKSLSLSEASLEFNIPSPSIIFNWQRRFAKDNLHGLSDKPKGRPESMTYKRAKKKSNKPLTREEELLLEIESLRAENALLKKLEALIQAEEAQHNNKRKP